MEITDFKRVTQNVEAIRNIVKLNTVTKIQLHIRWKYLALYAGERPRVFIQGSVLLYLRGKQGCPKMLGKAELSPSFSFSELSLDEEILSVTKEFREPVAPAVCKSLSQYTNDFAEVQWDFPDQIISICFLLLKEKHFQSSLVLLPSPILCTIYTYPHNMHTHLKFNVFLSL